MHVCKLSNCTKWIHLKNFLASLNFDLIIILIEVLPKYHGKKANKVVLYLAKKANIKFINFPVALFTNLLKYSKTFPIVVLYSVSYSIARSLTLCALYCRFVDKPAWYICYKLRIFNNQWDIAKCHTFILLGHKRHRRCTSRAYVSMASSCSTWNY